MCACFTRFRQRVVDYRYDPFMCGSDGRPLFAPAWVVWVQAIWFALRGDE